MGGGSKVFTLAEVSTHDNANDCWLAIHGKVYDVTNFLEDHPGGNDVLLSATGKDASDDFEDIGRHSKSARAMLEQYYVGDFDSSTIPTTKTTNNYAPPPPPPPRRYNQDSDFIIKIVQFLLPPLFILGLALVIYTKSSSS